MKLLKIYPPEDNPQRHNYHVNYGLWDCLPGTKASMHQFNLNLANYDAVLLPQYKRWKKNMPLLQKIKNNGIKTILFDNDSCYRSFAHPFYNQIDFIFYRDTDINNQTPATNSQWLPWSIDTSMYKPQFGGKQVVFSCSISNHYPLRKKISTIIKPTKATGNQYIALLQSAAAAIHTDSPTVPSVRAKALEFAACGTQIISNKTSNMHLFFPHHLIVYFNNIDHLKQIIHSFKPNISIQKQLRQIAVDKHDNTVRAKQVLQVLQKILSN